MHQLEVNGLYVTVDCDTGNGAKAPVSLNVCLSETAEPAASSDLECYYYTILSKKKVLGIPLRDTQSDWLRDLARLCATMATKQYGKPCYVAVSLSSSGATSAFQFSTPQILEAIKKVL